MFGQLVCETIDLFLQPHHRTSQHFVLLLALTLEFLIAFIQVLLMPLEGLFDMLKLAEGSDRLVIFAQRFV